MILDSVSCRKRVSFYCFVETFNTELNLKRTVSFFFLLTKSIEQNFEKNVSYPIQLKFAKRWSVLEYFDLQRQQIVLFHFPTV